MVNRVGVMSSFGACPEFGGEDWCVLRDRVLPWAQRDAEGGGAVVGEGAVGWAFGRQRVAGQERLGRRWSDTRRVGASGLGDGHGQGITAGAAFVRQVKESCGCVRGEDDEGLGEIAGECRRADLVVDDIHAAAVAQHREDGAGEVLAAPAVDPSGTGDGESLIGGKHRLPPPAPPGGWRGRGAGVWGGGGGGGWHSGLSPGPPPSRGPPPPTPPL